jgi:hypothetical protein
MASKSEAMFGFRPVSSLLRHLRHPGISCPLQLLTPHGRVNAYLSASKTLLLAVFEITNGVQE